MKLKNIKDPEEFMKVIDSCKGTVEMVTEEGDRLNLKSKLCQYISFAKMFESEANISDIEIVAYEPEDTKKLIEYMMRG